MRFTNTGQLLNNGVSLSFDLVVSNRSAYSATDPSANGLQNGLARISVAYDSEVELRVQLKLSCDPPGALNCGSCAAITDVTSRTSCYQAGCACFGSLVSTESECTGARYEHRRLSYGCAAGDSDVVFPESSEPVTMSILDFDGARNRFGGYIAERVQLFRYTNWRTPLRPGLQYAVNPTGSTITVDEISAGQTPGLPASLRATSTEVGDATNDPVDILDLTPAQASRGIQVFFTPELGYVDGIFSVVDTGVIRGFGTGDRHFLIGGNSGLCYPPPSLPSPPAPPPPLPPPLPPSPPPNSPPPPPACTLCDRLYDAVDLTNACVKIEGGIGVCRPPGHWGCPSDMWGCPDPWHGQSTAGGGPNDVTPDVPPVWPDCVDILGARKCAKKRRRGKCSKRGVRERKCRFTCGQCENTQRHPPV